MKTFKEFIIETHESLDERIKMGDTKGLTSYKSPESEFKKGDDVRVPVGYVTPYENDEKIHTAHTVAAKFSRSGDKFHHVKVDGEDVAVPKHHVFPANLSGKNYKEGK